MKSLLIPVLMTILVSCQQKIDLDAGILEGGETADYIRGLSGPVGIVMMDFAGVDRSGGTEVGGKKLVEAVIGHN